MKVVKVNPVMEWMRWRISRSKNIIITIVGPTGSGKTYSAIWMAMAFAKMMGTSFTIKNNLDFHFSKLLKKTMLPENRKAGTCFVFEEVGSVASGASSMEWQSKMNKFFTSFMMTTRHRQQVLFFTTPIFGSLQKQVRELTHMLIETHHIDFQKRLAYVKCYAIQTNMRTGKMYFKYLRFRHKGQKGKLKFLAIPLIPKDVADEYEKAKHNFTASLNQSIIKEDPIRKLPKVNDDRLKELVGMGFKDVEIARRFGCSSPYIWKKRQELGLTRKKPKKIHTMTKNKAKNN